MATEIISRADAKARGLTVYFTGLFCKNLHIAERRTANGGCVVCLNTNEQAYRRSNPEKYREKSRRDGVVARARNPERIKRNNEKWVRANPDKVKAKKQRYRAKNLDRVRELEKKWRDANPDKIAKKNRRYKTEHAERLAPIAIERTKEWRTLNPDKTRENGRKARRTRRARLLGAAGSHTDEQVQALLERQNWKCIVPKCGASLRERRELDHKTALARGGSNDITNLQWLCPTCNRKKRDKDLSVWAQEHGISL